MLRETGIALSTYDIRACRGFGALQNEVVIPMISYAKQFQDIMLVRALNDVPAGCYIDIGAGDPVKNSVSLLFYERGWRGLHIEPLADYAEKLKVMRPDEFVIQAAVCEYADQITLYQTERNEIPTAMFGCAIGHSCPNQTLAAVKVPCLPLSQIFDTFNRRHIHWMKIDMAGMERDVLRSWRDHAARPWIVVVEAAIRNQVDASHKLWEDEVLSRGYGLAYFDGSSRFYVHEAHKERVRAFAQPPNVSDQFVLSETSPFVGLVAQQKAELASRLNECRQLLEAEQAASKKALEAHAADVAAFLKAHENERDRWHGELEALRCQIAELEAVLAAESAGSRTALEARESEILKLSHAFETERAASQSQLAACELEIDEWKRRLEAERADFQKALASERTHSAELQTKLTEKTVELRVLHELLQARQNGHNETLLQLAAQISALQNDLEGERRKTLTARAEVENYQIQLTQAAHDRDMHAGEVGYVQALLSASRSETVELQNQVKGLLNRIYLLESGLRSAQLEVTAIRQSTSWQVTAPLRRVSEALKATGRPVLEMCLHFVRSHSWLRAAILGLSGLVPPVQRKLKHFAKVRPPIERRSPLKPAAIGQLPQVQSLETVSVRPVRNGDGKMGAPASSASGTELGQPDRVAEIQRRLFVELNSRQ